MNLIFPILQFLLISLLIQCGIAAFLILFGKVSKGHSEERGLAFDELLFDYSTLPGLKSFTARDGQTLSYRFYPSTSETMVILIHGSG